MTRDEERRPRYLTERQRIVLAAMDPNGLSYADDIAHALGYRPARSGRLAVTATLRSMLEPNTDRGRFVGRIAPRDQWSSAMWSITDAGIAAIAPTPTETSDGR